MISKRRLIALVLLLALTGVFSFPDILAAGCKSDCEDTYQSSVDDCHLTYDSPDDADSLQICVESAKAEYDSCVDDCDS